ncbi:peptidoglycan-binding domain-containing protein [Bacteroides faecium]|uniref:Peptidoglycan-binding protein n=1 Tax=Bacteroides faecium TaxID=2715212 RepID=A0A6H0KVN5_9BACE|nr:peptidoglycan-binding protein [Bacteroides faecium]QIU97121.1 peptidoglycan-binding protein [Bacteroides faecium]
MKKSSKKIIKSVLLSAIVSLFHANAEAVEAQGLSLSLDDLNNGNKKDEMSPLNNKIYYNVLKLKKNGDLTLIAGHRSHYSHRSSGGGGHYSHSSHRSSSYGGSYSSGSSNSGSSTSYSTPKKTYATYSLGDRILTSGSYGADVTKLTDLLVLAKYLRKNWITQKSNYSQFNNHVVSAIKRFQKDAGLKQTGVVDATTISHLQAWDTNKTTIVLGIRDLQYIDSTSIVSGNDVSELVVLLKKAGYAPDPSKLQYSGQQVIFTEDIAMAIKMFQAYNSLSVTGIADEKTIQKLRSKIK